MNKYGMWFMISLFALFILLTKDIFIYSLEISLSCLCLMIIYDMVFHNKKEGLITLF